MTCISPKVSYERRVLLAVQSAQNILAQHVEPGGLDEKATIDALLAVLDDSEVVEAVHELQSNPYIRGPVSTPGARRPLKD